MADSHTVPKVSAIIPFYKGERFVADAVRSVLAQTEPSVEAIVIDDGSPDSASDALGPLLADPRVRLLTHERNRGIAAARNTGLRASDAEFVGFLDQDDLWLPEKTERQLAVFDGSPADIGLVFSPVETRDAEGHALRTLDSVGVPQGLNEMSRTDALRSLYRGSFVVTASVLLKRECFEVLGVLDEGIHGGADDYEFWLRLGTRYRMRYLDTVTAVRRMHGGNFSADLERLVADTLVFAERVGRSDPELEDLVDSKLAWLHARLGSYYRNEGLFAKARASYRASLERSFSARTALLLAAASLGPLGGWFFRVRRGRLTGRAR
jgi:glycosyltransferase involved in cell wall biosynthesis